MDLQYNLVCDLYSTVYLSALKKTQVVPAGLFSLCDIALLQHSYKGVLWLKMYSSLKIGVSGFGVSASQE